MGCDQRREMNCNRQECLMSLLYDNPNNHKALYIIIHVPMMTF